MSPSTFSLPYFPSFPLLSPSLFPLSFPPHLSLTPPQDIWNQVQSLNPDFDPFVPPPDSVTTLTPNKPEGPLLCGDTLRMATGSFFDARRLMEFLFGLGGSWSIEPSQCIRLGCTANTGLYWCNDNAWQIATLGMELYWELDRVLGLCCKFSQQKGPFNALGGVASFPDSHSQAAFSRVVLGYADCHDPVDTEPLDYHYPGDDQACIQNGTIWTEIRGDGHPLPTEKAVLPPRLRWRD